MCRGSEHRDYQPLVRCFWCDQVVGFEGVVDHVVPQRKGGPDLPWNAVTACVACNSSKKDWWPSDWVANRLYDRIGTIVAEAGYAEASHFLLLRKQRAYQVESEFRRWAVQSGNEQALRHLTRRGQDTTALESGE
jgi:hypothetical protein